MEKPVAKIVIVGGGTAGWITACLVAAEHGRVAGRDVRVVLIESPDVPTIGVGEGTWPSMRATLKKIRIDELALIRDCDASFKQGTHFIDWTEPGSSYLHPFSLPAEYPSVPLTEYWLASGATESFAEFVTPQADVINAGLAPKQASMPPYAFAVNYGYHFDAGKFAALLHRHAVNELGVEYVSANVEKVEADSGGDIAALGLDTDRLHPLGLAGDPFGHGRSRGRRPVRRLHRPEEPVAWWALRRRLYLGQGRALQRPRHRRAGAA